MDVFCFQFENFKLLLTMNIVARGTIAYCIEKYPAAKVALLTWYNEFLKAEYKSFNELKNVHGNASIVGSNRVIFNIKGNDFRLIISINFKRLAAYTIWFGTHKEYDKINVETIEFNVAILNYKSRKK